MDKLLFKLRAFFTTTVRVENVLDKAEAFRMHRTSFFKVVRFTVEGELFCFYPVKEFIGVTAVYLFDEKNHKLNLYNPKGELVDSVHFEFIRKDNKNNHKGVDYYITPSNIPMDCEYKDFLSITHVKAGDNQDWYRNGTKLNPEYWNGVQDARELEDYYRAHNPRSSMSHIDRWLTLNKHR
jgi:hypothetical protein